MTGEPPPLTFNSGDDLFAVPPPRTGRGHPDTSRQAADRVSPAVPAIRDQILRWAANQGAGGFSDELLTELEPDERRVDRSFIPRRAELAEEGWLVDTGRRVRNKRGNQCVVWCHRDHVTAPPPVTERAKPDPKTVDLKARGKATAHNMLEWSDSMKAEGRVMFANALKDAADIVRQLSV